MSGYLRWLAERALGPASGLRPARGPRSFAGEPSRGSDGAAAFMETARPGDFSAAERHARPPDRTGVARSDAMPATLLTSASAATAAAAAAQTDAPAVAAPAQHIDAPAPQARSDADRRVEHADPSAIDDRPQRAGPGIADGNTSSHIPGRRGSIPQAALAPRMATRPARSRPAGDPSDRRWETPPAPDVHIHIGRVELTAVTPVAPARRESAASPKKPMSLEEYLRRRSGRPS